MVRVALIAIALASSACSSSSFDVASAADTGTTSMTDSATAETEPPADADSPPEIGPPVDASSCGEVHGTTADIFVSTAAPVGGNGSVECPFRTLTAAAAVPLTAGTYRTVHVIAGTHNEGAITVRPLERYVGDGGVPKIVPPSTAAICKGLGPCAFNLNPGSELDGFLIDGGGAAHGVVATGTATPVARIRNVTIRGMARDGIVVSGAGLTLGPNTHSNENGGDGLQSRSGKIFINEGPNGFDANAGAGIHLFAGQLFLDNVVTASSNNVGVLFDRTGLSSLEQVLSQIDILSNKTSGVVVGKDWTRLQIRKAKIVRNAHVGVWLEYNDAGTNAFDLGSTGSGGNIFGSPSSNNNTRAGIFLCRSGAGGSFVANGNNWSACAPTRERVLNCDTWPASYKDIAYVPSAAVGGTTGPDPLAAPTSCTATAI